VRARYAITQDIQVLPADQHVHTGGVIGQRSARDQVIQDGSFFEYFSARRPPRATNRVLHDVAETIQEDLAVMVESARFIPQ